MLLVSYQYAIMIIYIFHPHDTTYTPFSKGWRKSMEDAHIAHMDINVNYDGPNGCLSKTILRAKLSIFGVFDGHGGMTITISICQIDVGLIAPIP